MGVGGGQFVSEPTRWCQLLVIVAADSPLPRGRMNTFLRHTILPAAGPQGMAPVCPDYGSGEGRRVLGHGAFISGATPSVAIFCSTLKKETLRLSIQQTSL
jgi:hypothetical protein